MFPYAKISRRSSLTVAVVIPCHNNADSLELVLGALASQSSIPEEIFCVDDASTPAQARAIAALARDHGARVLCLPLTGTSHGRRSMARNAGLHEALSDVVLYLDGDMIIGPDYIATLRLFHSLDHKAVVKGVRYSFPQSQQSCSLSQCLDIVFEQKIAALAAERIYRPPRRRIRASSNNPATENTTGSHRPIAPEGSYLQSTILQSAESVEVGIGRAPQIVQTILPYSQRWDFCASNNLSVRRSAALAVGGWDEGFLGWGEEDIDFAYRLFRSGCHPVLPEGGPLYAYHLDHAIDEERNLLSLRRNARYLIKKYPILAAMREPAYRQYGIDCRIHLRLL